MLRPSVFLGLAHNRLVVRAIALRVSPLQRCPDCREGCGWIPGLGGLGRVVFGENPAFPLEKGVHTALSLHHRDAEPHGYHKSTGSPCGDRKVQSRKDRRP